MECILAIPLNYYCTENVSLFEHNVQMMTIYCYWIYTTITYFPMLLKAATKRALVPTFTQSPISIWNHTNKLHYFLLHITRITRTIGNRTFDIVAYTLLKLKCTYLHKICMIIIVDLSHNILGFCNT